MILLSSGLTIGIIGGVLLVLILAAAVYFVLRKKNTKAAAEFIEGLGNAILEITLTTIAEAVPDKDSHQTLADFEAELIQNIYNTVWDYVANEAEHSQDVDYITKTVFKLIKKEQVVAFIDKMFEDNDIFSKMADRYTDRANEITVAVEAEELELEKEYSNQEDYVEVSKDEELAPAKEEEHTPEEIAALNPPRDDEEEEVDMDDVSQEIIVENDKKEIITTQDKNGNTLYYEITPDGKKTRVSKAYAEENK